MEGVVHFKPSEKPELIGRKALARALSDLAAMGAVPLAAVITLGMPKDESVARLKENLSVAWNASRRSTRSIWSAARPRARSNSSSMSRCSASAAVTNRCCVPPRKPGRCHLRHRQTRRHAGPPAISSSSRAWPRANGSRGTRSRPRSWTSATASAPTCPAWRRRPASASRSIPNIAPTRAWERPSRRRSMMARTTNCSSPPAPPTQKL